MKRSVLKLGWAMFLVVFAGAVVAAEPNVEASMVVFGTIKVNPDGSVNGYTLSRQSDLPPAVLQVVEKTVPNWKFKPVVLDGKAVTAEADMSLRIVAHTTDAQHATIRIAAADFGRDARSRNCAEGACLTPKKRKPPLYPVEAVGATTKVTGTVYLVLEIDRTGHVAKAAVRQVNLGVMLEGYDATMARRGFTRVSLAAARDWTFNVPTKGSEADKPHWVVVVPVAFWGGGTRPPGYGQWNAYVPGPVQSIPWENDDRRNESAGQGDAVASGTVFQSDPRFVLLTLLGNVAG